jgi:hypothetical protein
MARPLTLRVRTLVWTARLQSKVTALSFLCSPLFLSSPSFFVT